MNQRETVARAWNSVTDRWVVRRNKMHDRNQWEVVHDWGGDLVSDDTMKVIGRYATSDEAQEAADVAEHTARAEAVLTALGLGEGGENVVVPREPTEAMKVAGGDIIFTGDHDIDDMGVEAAHCTYRAMLSDRPQDGEAGE